MDELIKYLVSGNQAIYQGSTFSHVFTQGQCDQTGFGHVYPRPATAETYILVLV